MKPLALDLRQVDFSDERYRTSPPVSLDKLLASLRAIGLRQPPLLTRHAGRWVIVSGWKRALACRTLALSPMPIFDTEERDELKNFLLGFLENAATRPMGLVEKAAALARLTAFGETREAIVNDYLPLLDLPRNADILQAHLDIDGFAPSLKEGLQERSIPLAVARRLIPFSPEERAAVFPYCLPLSQNKQKELLENLHEVCRRENLTVSGFLNQGRVQDVLRPEQLSPLQKSELLRREVFRARFPAYSSQREDFERTRSALDLPPGVGLEPAAFFEKDEISVSFRARTPSEFRAILDKLGTLAADEHFRKIFFWMD